MTMALNAAAVNSYSCIATLSNMVTSDIPLTSICRQWRPSPLHVFYLCSFRSLCKTLQGKDDVQSLPTTLSYPRQPVLRPFKTLLHWPSGSTRLRHCCILVSLSSLPFKTLLLCFRVRPGYDIVVSLSACPPPVHEPFCICLRVRPGYDIVVSSSACPPPVP